MPGLGRTPDCGCSAKVRLGKQDPDTARGHETVQAAVVARPSQAAPVAAAADVATVAVASTQSVFAGLVSAAHVLWAHRCAESGQPEPSASGLARDVAAVDNYGETEHHLVTFSLVLGCVHVVAEGR